ncbi:MAG: hypothetical protein HON90_13060 [Halobacteriovoraceae bacterium]|jgi:agmatine/peptidylarginine deiminase|nr:hypothetical protein [Halobacteriovoraceae bacterium]
MWSDCEQSVKPKLPTAKGRKGQSDEIQYKYDWVAHTNEVRAYFENLGYKVELVDQPLPVYYEMKNHYFDSNGKKIASIKEKKYFFPSYVNSVLMNESVGMPVYSEYASDKLNNKAIQSYKKYKNKVTPLEQSSSILLDGGPHCWTSNLLEI